MGSRSVPPGRAVCLVLALVFGLVATVVSSGCSDNSGAGLLPGAGGGGAPNFQGTPWNGDGRPHMVSTWKVVTKVVSTQAPVNPVDKPGHLRDTVWRVASQGADLQLTSPEGTISGKLRGTTFVFDGWSDTGQGLRIHTRIEGFLTSATRIVGTIEVWYHGTFNNLVGKDSWQFEGRR